jgi:hypothetical protein
MKITDVIISEAPVAGAPGNVTKTGTGASGFPINQTGVPANQRPNMVRDPRLLTNIDGGAGAIAGAQAGKVTPKKATPAAGKTPAQPTLNGQPSTGPKGQAWLKKYGATHNPDGTPKAAAAPAAAPAPATNVPAPSASNELAKGQVIGNAMNPAPAEPAKPSDGTTAEIDRLQQLGGINAQVANPFAPKPPAAAQAAQAAPEEPAAAEPAAGQRPGGIAFNQDAGTTAPEPAAQAAQPAPAPAPAVPAPAAPSTVAPVVKTGSGGTLTTRDGKPVTSRSDDEIAWAQKNPYQPYPGPGWQEKQKAQGDANAAAVKGFLNKINPFAKKEPAPVAGQGGQAAPANPGSPQAPAAFRQGQMESAELAIIRKLSGLK